MNMEKVSRELASYFDNLSIRTKLILNVVFIVLILGVLMGSYLNVVQTSMMKTELNEKGISVTRNLAENSVNPILTDNHVRLQWLVETIKESESEVIYVFILDERGEVMVHTFDEGFPVDLKGINPALSGTGTQLLDTEQGYIRDISYPILEGKAGEVHVGMSQESIRTTIDRFTVILGLFVLLLMFAGSGIAYFSGSVISRPIMELKKGVEIFGEGKLDHKVDIRSGNEIGLLADSFNDMAEHIGYLVAEKEKAAKEVLDTRNYLTKIVSGSLDGIVVTDDAGRIEFANEAFLHIMESDKDAIIGSDLRSIFKEKEEDLKMLLQKPEVNVSFIHELDLTTPGGKIKSVILSMGSVEYQNQIKYVAVAKDITQIKKLEQAKRNIIANISHELRTPLNIMKGYVEISMDEQDGEKRNSYLKTSLKALEKQNWMIQDLLEIARSEDESAELDIVKTNLNGIVEIACRTFNGKLDSMDVNVVKKFEEDRFIKADPEKLAYALTKLIDNALKFTDKDGYIEIGTMSGTDSSIVYVKDTGTGIPEDKLEHIFEKFYQVDGSSTRKFGGNGLGLAIAKNIIDLHDGKIWVESEPGKGSTFYFSVPSLNVN
ncbi:MAG: two-component hybrid sensor and regulator [Methanolobus sp. T82-4]|nr:MAG: two-component hybrid sensor and regulator [Methanolobus sp. T82-4]